MKNMTCYLVLLAFVLMVSCSPISIQNASQISTSIETPDMAPTINSPAETATIPPTVSTDKCLEFQQNLPANLKGVVVLSGKNSLYQPALPLQETPAYIKDLVSGNKINLPYESGGQVGDFSVSPNRKWLAYYAQQSGMAGDVYIIGNNGTLFNKYSANDWWNVLDWLDNDHLLMGKSSQHNPYPSLIFNPFTGKTEKELLPSYPDIFTGSSMELYTWDRYQLPETVYDTNLDMVVYPKNPNTFVLWDIIAQKEITEITDLSASSHAPLWLSNGKEFIIDITAKNTPENWIQDELISVGIDRQIRQLTNMADLPYKNVSIQNYSESDDGRYIAFWFAQINAGPSRLAIYDTELKNTEVLCNVVGGYVPPVWSPSGHQLLIDGTFDNL